MSLPPDGLASPADEAMSLLVHPDDEDEDDESFEDSPRSLRLLPKVALLALIFGIVASPALRPAQEEQPKRAWRSTSSESWTHGADELPVVVSIDLMSNDVVRNFVLEQTGVDSLDDLSDAELNNYVPSAIQVGVRVRGPRVNHMSNFRGCR